MSEMSIDAFPVSGIRPARGADFSHLPEQRQPSEGQMRSHRPVAAADGADQVVTIEPMDVMTFDDDGLITSMRAYWGPADAITTQGE